MRRELLPATRAPRRLLLVGLLLATAACDGSEGAAITPDPARTTTEAASAPEAAPAAQLERSAPLQSAVPLSTAAPTSSAPPTASAAPTSTAAPTTPAPTKTAAPARSDPPNPCVARYEERVGEDGKTTRVLIPRDKRCDYKGEGGISPKGAYYGY